MPRLVHRAIFASGVPFRVQLRRTHSICRLLGFSGSAPGSRKAPCFRCSYGSGVAQLRPGGLLNPTRVLALSRRGSARSSCWQVCTPRIRGECRAGAFGGLRGVVQRRQRPLLHARARLRRHRRGQPHLQIASIPSGGPSASLGGHARRARIAARRALAGLRVVLDLCPDHPSAESFALVAATSCDLHLFIDAAASALEPRRRLGEVVPTPTKSSGV